MGRDRAETLIHIYTDISIHAPRVGRDQAWFRPVGYSRYFNPRAPCGARQIISCFPSVSNKFQSTRPVWGATMILSAAEYLDDISIHAPRVGRDQKKLGETEKQLISIHAPRVGRDDGITPTIGSNGFQSTRPVWGATATVEDGADGAPDFNPRAPCGARLLSTLMIAFLAQFQSTRPVWGATTVRLRVYACRSISIHAPRVGRDAGYVTNTFDGLKFQSTRPVWGATGVARREKKSLRISIHAPRVGRDHALRRGV